MRDISPNDPCPCGSGKKYKKCCRPYHAGLAAPTPVDLLRARYSAYVLRNIDFIMKTTHPESPHIEVEHRWRASLESYTMRTIYEALDILEIKDDAITYRVQYYNMLGRGSENYTTISNFRQYEGKWYYFDDSDVAKAEESAE
jgi:SEC-C motif domain protein